MNSWFLYIELTVHLDVKKKKNTIILIEKGEERKKKSKIRERNMIFYII